MIKTTDEHVDKDSDLFLAELKLDSELKDKLMEFVDYARKNFYKNSLINNGSEYDLMFSAFRCEFDVSLNVHLDESDKLSISVGGGLYVEFAYLSSSKERSKCRQFHIIKLKPRTRYYECFKNLCYGKHVTEKDLDWLVKKVKSKILDKHSEINTAKLEVLSVLQSNNNDTDWISLLYGQLKLHKTFDLILSTRSVDDNFICNLPDEVVESYRYRI